MHVHMVFTDHAFEYPDILCIADLYYQFPAPLLYLTLQDMICILYHPDYMSLQLTYCMVPTSHIVHTISLEMCSS